MSEYIVERTITKRTMYEDIHSSILCITLLLYSFSSWLCAHSRAHAANENLLNFILICISVQIQYWSACIVCKKNCCCKKNRCCLVIFSPSIAYPVCVEIVVINSVEYLFLYFCQSSKYLNCPPKI